MTSGGETHANYSASAKSSVANERKQACCVEFSTVLFLAASIRWIEFSSKGKRRKEYRFR